MLKKLRPALKAPFVHARMKLMQLGKRKFLNHGKTCISARVPAFGPRAISQLVTVSILAKQLNISPGNHVLIPNYVASVGRHDHDFSAIGWPARLSPWVGDLEANHPGGSM